MTTTRRALLGAGLAGGAAVLVGCTEDDREPPETPGPGSVPSGEPVVPDFGPEDWASVRAQFPLDPALAHVAAFVLSPHTLQVEAAVAHHRRLLGWDTEGCCSRAPGSRSGCSGRPGDAVRRLRGQAVIASATPYATSYLRLGPSLVTTPEQVDAAVEAVASLR